MISVALYSMERGHRQRAGTVTFLGIPLDDPIDFQCHPADLLPFDQAKKIADQIRQKISVGHIGMYEWNEEA